MEMVEKTKEDKGKEMKKLLFLSLVSLFLVSCGQLGLNTKLTATFPVKIDGTVHEVPITYEYPFWQQKYLTVEKNENGFKLNFASTSEPITEAMQVANSALAVVNRKTTPLQ